VPGSYPLSPPDPKRTDEAAQAALSAIQEALDMAGQPDELERISEYREEPLAQRFELPRLPARELIAPPAVEAELNLETLRYLQEEANKFLVQEEWEQIDGLIAPR
jgi:hypothetical protein